MAMQEGRETLTKLSSKWQILNEKMALSLGQKTFQATKKELLQAIVTGFPTVNTSILNMNKEMGFLVAEGSGIISATKEKEIFEKEIKPDYEKESTLLTWNYTPGNYTVRINVNIFKKKQGLLVKLRLSSKTAGGTPGASVGHVFATPLLREHYRTLWEVIDKSLFMQKETS